MEQITFSKLKLGKRPVCIIGAGFSSAMLENPPPSTQDIIKTTIENNENNFHLLKILVNNIQPINLSLNYIWKNIKYMAERLIPFYNNIEKAYKESPEDQKILNLIEFYKSQNATEEDILWILLGIELKKIISFNYNKYPINKENWNNIAFDNITNLLNNNEDAFFSWISLNYDLVLENFLFRNNNEKFNINTKKIRYSFSHLLTNSFKDFSPKHFIIKPHGSVNISFKTDYTNNKNKHAVAFIDQDDFWKTVNPTNYGYTKNEYPFIEERACLIGYVPDEVKDELNSKAFFSDMAHDFCKYNMTTTSFSFYHATSLIIIGYSMPNEDSWIWERIKNIPNYDINIYIACRNRSDLIKTEFKNIGFKNVFIINKGNIN